MSGVADIVVEADDAAFDGHFPGAPVWPGACLLDAVALRLPAATDGPLRFSGVKFRRPVLPGMRLRVRFTRAAAGGTRFVVEGTDATVVADGTVESR